MILVDSSVWIASQRGSPQALESLRRANASAIVAVAEIVLLEVLRGARDDRHAAFLQARFRSFPLLPVLDERIAVEAARNYRLLRAKGFIVRKTPDLIIGTYCIVHGHHLLHDDRDFDPMADHLGLKVY